jgi:hypothetical protein
MSSTQLKSKLKLLLTKYCSRNMMKVGVVGEIPVSFIIHPSMYKCSKLTQVSLVGMLLPGVAEELVHFVLLLLVISR